MSKTTLEKKSTTTPVVPFKKQIKHFLIEFGKRTDWRPRNKAEVKRMKTLVYTLIAVAIIALIATEIVQRL